MPTENPLIPYSHKSMFAAGKPRVYRRRQLDNIAFPLGGIGTGMVSLGGWGQLRDFELFNRPAKGLAFNNTFFTLYAKRSGEPSVTRVVQGPVGSGDFTVSGSGIPRPAGAGLPHFRGVTFTGVFPFARLKFTDPAMPLKVEMEAYNPFIPGNADDSGLPLAMFNFTLHNASDKSVKAVLFASLENRVGHPQTGNGRIECFEREGVSGLLMSNRKHAADSPRHGTLALVSTQPRMMVQTHGQRGRWFDSLHSYWDQMSEGELRQEREPAELDEGMDVGAIGLPVKIGPRQTVRLSVWLVWHTPNFEKYWGRDDPKPTWRNHYATRFTDAAAVADYAAANESRLEAESNAFSKALHASTLPAPVLDAVASQLAILKTTTCLRLEDGAFYGWEGCSPTHGCCEGTCTHVWNYAQALPYLFPELERSIRDKDYAHNLTSDGRMEFRMSLPPGAKSQARFHAAADGQMGGILKMYRDWLICGDNRWLRKLWPKVKRSLAYAWEVWDPDRDGVMEGVQHNTYDIEFHGPNTMMGSFYLGALRAAEEMARELGDDEAAEEYRGLFERGQAGMDSALFNGEYYIQHVRMPEGEAGAKPCCAEGCCPPPDPKDANFPKYQYGEGCLSDQMIGQWYARMLRLGDLFEADNISRTLGAIFKYNWKSDLSNHANPQRIYAVNDEAGLLLASWPHGGRPAFPFVYSDEVWCGIEYQVASHLIYEGFIEEGLAVVKGVRDRHDGVRRNPWNEFECGNHYARSMASYSLLLALSDFFYSAKAQALHFAPRVNAEDFACFFAVDSAWGMVRQKLGPDKANEARIEVHSGKLRLANVSLGFIADAASASLGGEPVNCACVGTRDGVIVRLAKAVTVAAGEALVIAGSCAGE